MLRIGICDDSELFCGKLNEIVNEAFCEYTQDFRVDCFSDGKSLLEANMELPFDALFLDVDMPDMDGFDIAEALCDDFSKCAIVFVSVHSELVFRSLEFRPFNFIRKDSAIPLEVSVPQVVKKFTRYLKQDEKLPMKDSSGRDVFVLIRDIIYLESDGHYVSYHFMCEGKLTKYRIRKSLTKCEKRLVGYDFIRVHKGYLVNLRHIIQFDRVNEKLTVKGNIQLNISRQMKQDAYTKYIEYLRNKS